ncbi:MAG: hypothetical protein IT449_02965 [Phycisphaerales bacterium]|nr:hypothetical protein [Phycisphaerales bacterium]
MRLCADRNNRCRRMARGDRSKSHVPLWALGVVVAIVLAWLYLLPRRGAPRRRLRAAALALLSVLSLASLVTGLVSYAAWSEVKILGHGYSGRWPVHEDAQAFVQMRCGQLIVGRLRPGRAGAREARTYDYGPFSSRSPTNLSEYRSYMLSEFYARVGSVGFLGPGPLVRADGLNILCDCVEMPFWFPTLLFAAYPAWAFILQPLRRRIRLRRARLAGLCPNCRYNLTGLTVPRCPECGGAVELPAVAPQTAHAHED